MTHGSLFSGIGGFDLAAEWMGWENKFHCEWNEFGQKVLHHYWPQAELFTDITKSDFTKYANTIDILTGGFPCQPYSSAGKRLGKEDDRHLWPQMLRAIREIQPRWVVGENVRGLTNWNGGLVFDEVQADLEAEGYEVLPFLLPACAVNAPHRRDRIWFVAYANTNGFSKQWGYECCCKNDDGSNAQIKRTTDSENIDNGNSSRFTKRQSSNDRGIGTERNIEKGAFANTRGVCEMDQRCNKCKGIIRKDKYTTNESRTLVQKGQIGVQLSNNLGMEYNKTNFESFRRDGQNDDNNNFKGMDRITSDSKSNGSAIGKLGESQTRQQVQTRGDINGFEGLGDATDSNLHGCDQRNGEHEIKASEGGFNALGNFNESNEYGDAADTSNIGREDALENRELEGRRFRESNQRNTWHSFPSVSPICNGDDGLSNRLDNITFPKWRNESIKAGGNAIVPQVVYQIFKAIEQYERIRTTNED